MNLEFQKLIPFCGITGEDGFENIAAHHPDYTPNGKPVAGLRRPDLGRSCLYRVHAVVFNDVWYRRTKAIYCVARS